MATITKKKREQAMNTRLSLVEWDPNLIRVEYLDDTGQPYYCCFQPRDTLRRDFQADVWLLSHDDVKHRLAQDLGTTLGFHVQPRFLKQGLPDGDCRGLVVDLASVAPGRKAPQRLVKELSGRSHPYAVAAYSYNLEDDQIIDIRAAGIGVFHCLCRAVFAWIAAPQIHQRSFPMNTNRFVWLLSHDEVDQYRAPDLGADHGLNVQTRFLKEGLPDRGRALVVDLDSVAPGRHALQRLVKELSGRLHAYPVAVFSYNLEDDQIMDLRAAGIGVFQHGLGPEVFAWIADQSSDGPCDGLV
jgi:hypothetical protein